MRFLSHALRLLRKVAKSYSGMIILLNWIAIPLFFLGLIGHGTAHTELIFYVATNGNDAWSGRLPDPGDGDGPFATLERARNQIRKIKTAGRPLPAGGVIVEFRGGVYELSQMFKLTDEDSGTETSPIIYRARSGENVRLTGGKQLKVFEPVTDPNVLRRLDIEAKNHVLQANLKIAGIGDFVTVANGCCRMELFFQNKPMTLARWPNQGFVKIADAPEGSKGSRIIYEGDRPNRWSGERDIWLHGYWFHDWLDSRQKIKTLDTKKREITLNPPQHVYGYKKGQRYYAENLLCELDSPGEWYVDHDTGILYFWPPGPLEQGHTYVSRLPTLVSISKAAHIIFRGIIFESTQGNAISISDGTNIKILNSTIRNNGGWAVSASGIAIAVIGCEIYNTGEGGINLIGGDRNTLTSAANCAENNHIYNFARLSRTYRPAIKVDGVGQLVRHNLIHDGPHNAILLGGNNHIIEFNEIFNVCYETGDAGAFYTGRRWDWQGTMIRYNYFHDILGPGQYGAMGVYLDDAASGVIVYGNLFRNVTTAVMIGGGRNITVENNIFVDCKPALFVDARGLSWMKYRIESEMPEMLKKMPYQSPPWSNHYPYLVNILQDEPGAPKYNKIVRNISFGGSWAEIQANAKKYLTMGDNIIHQDSHLVNFENSKVKLPEEASVYPPGFDRLPLEKVGLYPDTERAIAY